MLPPHPADHGVEDGTVDLLEDFARNQMAIVVDPPSNPGIEQVDQLRHRDSVVCLDRMTQPCPVATCPADSRIRAREYHRGDLP